jgi:hypothetical protein
MPPDALTAIYRSHPAAQKLFDWIAQAETEANRTTVEELIDNCDVSRRHAINLLRALADAGYGEFKVGRKGHPSRFEWAEDPQVLAERLEQLDGRDAGDDEQLEQAEAKPSNGPALDNGELFVEMFPQTETVAHEPPTSLRRRATARELELIEHSYVLRPKLRIVLKLPEDLSAREAEVLAEWLRNLSFQR